MGDVIYLRDRMVRGRARRPLTNTHLDSSDKFQARLERIKTSLRKIDSLMKEFEKNGK